MRLDGIKVEPVQDMAATAFRAEWGGCSVLVPADEAERFSAGAIHRLTEKATREGYRVIVVAKHQTTVGTCVVLKLWNPN